MYEILSGKEASFSIRNKLKLKVSNLNLKLVVIKIGEDISSEIYIKNKKKACEEVGIKFEKIIFNSTVKEKEVINKIKELNFDNSVTGIMLHLPISNHLDSRKIIDTIDFNKDVDGLTTKNIGKLFNEGDAIIPCTAKGILSLLKYYNISLNDKSVCIIGRSNLVGKPLANIFTSLDATVSLCHSKTRDLESYTRKADIIISAVGKTQFLKKEMVKENSIIIDVGINMIDGKICGDVDFDSVKEKVSYITPVPGGVGIMTVTSLLENIYECYKMQNS